MGCEGEGWLSVVLYLYSDFSAEATRGGETPSDAAWKLDPRDSTTASWPYVVIPDYSSLLPCGLPKSMLEVDVDVLLVCQEALKGLCCVFWRSDRSLSVRLRGVCPLGTAL